MALIVQKYGGTSVAGIPQIQNVAARIRESHAAGHQLVVVVSAMAGETDRLLALAQSLGASPDPRSLDLLLSTGEQQSVALLSLALVATGCPNTAYTGPQVPIQTNPIHTRARILAIDPERIQADLALGRVVIVAGFQGLSPEGDVTTLGRGGSDTTAVALAAVLGADECQIYTDVAGVYTVDPQIVAKAQFLEQMGVEALLEMASSGAKVVQHHALAIAAAHEVPLRVLSSFETGSGTVVHSAAVSLKHAHLSALALGADQVQCLIEAPVSATSMVDWLLSLSQAHIELDMLAQSIVADRIRLTFSIHQRERHQTLALLRDCFALQKDLSVAAPILHVQDQLAKLAIVGTGLRSDPQIRGTLLSVLQQAGIPIQGLCVSESRVCVLIHQAHLKQGAALLQEAFFESLETYDNSHQEEERDNVNFNETCG